MVEEVFSEGQVTGKLKQRDLESVASWSMAIFVFAERNEPVTTKTDKNRKVREYVIRLVDQVELSENRNFPRDRPGPDANKATSAHILYPQRSQLDETGRDLEGLSSTRQQAIESQEV